MVQFSDGPVPAYEEYLDFLKRCDLGSQYPRQNFEARVRTVLRNLDVCITARTDAGLLVGICFGLTDFAYFLFLTDLGVDRDYAGQGIGRQLLEMAHARAGGEDDITVTTISNDNALGFYEKCGMRPAPDLVVKHCRVWEDFTVA